MVKRTVEIVNEAGLHARPATEFVKKTQACKCDVFIEKNGKRMNAKSILGILALGLSKGSKVDIITDGEDEEKELEVLADFVMNLTE